MKEVSESHVIVRLHVKCRESKYLVGFFGNFTYLPFSKNERSFYEFFPSASGSVSSAKRSEELGS